MSFLFLAVGFVLLIKGADILIDSSAKLAHLLAIPSFIIGFSVIAFGTSAPELAIGIFSGIRQANLITLGDVIGSCIANILLIVGITAFIYPLDVEKSVLKKDIPISFAVQLLLTGLLLLDGRLSRIDAAILLVLFAGFLFYIFLRAKEMEKTSAIREENGHGGLEPIEAIETTKVIETIGDSELDKREVLQQEEMEEEAEELLEADAEMKEAQMTSVLEVRKHSAIKLAGLILLSLIGIIGGANLIVNSSTDIARMLGMSDVLIGITVVAIGTSLPELVTSIVAALKRQSDLAMGNIIGSNIFNVLFVLGASVLIHPIPAPKGIGMDAAFMLMATLAVFLLPLRRQKISRRGGFLLLFLYAMFMTYKAVLGIAG